MLEGLGIRDPENPGVPTLEACIASFFAPEPVTWVCPAETAARKAAAGGARGRGGRRRSVSFSGALLGRPKSARASPRYRLVCMVRMGSVALASTTCMCPVSQPWMQMGLAGGKGFDTGGG